jgi:ribulose-5-phosphate 4-epimerase/fuculose-1-phosphate aldolase
VSDEEWAVRVNLAAAYRLVSRYGWEDLVFTHISARVPGTEDQFLINPYGLFFDEITASSLVKIDQQGRKLEDSPFKVNEAGFIIHSAIHAARHDARCVLHTHTANGVAVSTQRAGLLPISQHSLFVLNNVGYHDFEGPALDEDEKPRLVADLGDNRCLILRNHGLLTVGETVADAFVNMYYLEASCQIQVRAQAGGGELISVPKEIMDKGTRTRWPTTRSGQALVCGPPAPAGPHGLSAELISGTRCASAGLAGGAARTAALTGRGRFTDDVELPGQAHAASPAPPPTGSPAWAARALALPGARGPHRARSVAADWARSPRRAFPGRGGSPWR